MVFVHRHSKCLTGISGRASICISKLPVQKCKSKQISSNQSASMLGSCHARRLQKWDQDPWLLARTRGIQRIACTASAAATSIASTTATSGSNPWNIIIVVAGIIALLLGIFWQNVQRVVRWGQRQVVATMTPDAEDMEAIDDKVYRVALARTRQGLLVNKAVIFMNAGNPARAVVELKRALQENAVCREPLLNARVSKPDLLGLYRLHLLNTEVPPDFAILLQLREMFELGNEEAEKLEEEVMENPAFFSI